MAQVTMAQGRSTWVNSGKPSLTYGPSERMRVDSGEKEGLLSFTLGNQLASPAVVTAATLYVPQVAALSGSRSFTVRRVERWNVNRVTWDTKPANAAGSADRTVTQSGTAAGYAWGFNVTADVQAVIAAGLTRLDVKLTTSDTATVIMSGFPGASLVVTYSTPSTSPTNLTPGGNALIGVAKPLLQYDAGDVVAHQVQVAPVGTTFDASAGFTSPTFDSGVLATTVTQFALSGSTYGGLTSGSTSWTVRVQNSGGTWSKWATPAPWSRFVKDAATVTQPTATVLEPTPPMHVTLPNIARMQWLIDLAETGKQVGEVYDSREIATTTGNHTPKKDVFVESGKQYRVTARAWPTSPPVANPEPGGEPYSQASIVTTFTLDPGVTPVASTSVTQVEVSPSVDVRVRRDVMPDSFVYVRDGVVQAEVGYLDPAELEVYPGVYLYRSHTTPPNSEHGHRLAPVVNGAVGAGLETYTTTDVQLRWLGDPATGEWVAFTGTDQEWSRPEDATVHVVDRSGLTMPGGGGVYPPGTLATIRRVRGKQAPLGSASGIVTTTNGGDGGEMIALAKKWQDRADQARVFRFVVGTENIAVTIGDLEVIPSPYGTAEKPAALLSFSYWSA